MMRVVVVGCGLIGGSLLALIKRHMPSTHIVGVDQDLSALAVAKKRGWVDVAVADLSPEILTGVDMVIIATPMAVVVPIIHHLTQTIQSPLTIIECSSVKSWLKTPAVQATHHTIVPVHPMGGLDTSGIDLAHADVLAGVPMIVFSSHPSNEFFRQCTFNITYCPSLECHDEWMAYVSHGPYVMAVLIPLLLSKKTEDDRKILANVSAGGFRDTTRVSNSSVAWGVSVLKENKGVMLAFLSNIMGVLKDFKDDIKHDRWDLVEDQLAHAKKARAMVVNP
ncbi:MAG: prephenate dehydrogenase [Candidatus Marinamargulisbacteria bacterium]